MKNIRVISTRFYNANQSWNFERTVKTGKHTLQIDIRRNSYDDQSHARIKRWDGTQWKIVVDAPITECHCKKHSYVENNAPMETFLNDGNRLLEEAINVIS